MALRLYSTTGDPTTSGTAPLFSVNSNGKGAWDAFGTAFVRRMREVKGGTNGTRTVSTSVITANWDVQSAVFQSDRLISGGRISGSAQWCFSGRESNAGLNAVTHAHIWVTQGDSDVVRGTLVDNYVDAEEWAVSATDTTVGTAVGIGPLTVNPVDVQAGDRIVFEIGYRANATATGYSTTVRYAGTGADLVDGATTVSTDVGWVELSGVNSDYSVPAGPPPAAPVFGDVFASSVSRTGNGASLDVPIPVQVTEGMLLVFTAVNSLPQDFNNTLTAVGFTIGTAWTDYAEGGGDDNWTGIWTKIADATDAANAGTGSYQVSLVTGTAIISAAILAFPGASATVRQGDPGIVLDTTSPFASPAPVTLPTVTGGDLGIYLFTWAERNASATTPAFSNIPATWTTLVNTVSVNGTGSTIYESGLLVLGKFGGGGTGDVPSVNMNLAGSFVTYPLVVSPAAAGSAVPTGMFLPFFMG